MKNITPMKLVCLMLMFVVTLWFMLTLQDDPSIILIDLLSKLVMIYIYWIWSTNSDALSLKKLLFVFVAHMICELLPVCIVYGTLVFHIGLYNFTVIVLRAVVCILIWYILGTPFRVKNK